MNGPQLVYPISGWTCGLFHFLTVVTATAKSIQSCPTLCDPIDPVPGILQARTLEWVAISLTNAALNSRV